MHYTDFLNKEDNASQHRGNYVHEFLENRDTEQIPLLAQSPNLNPANNVWNYLRKALARR